jgi:hypothetical protein
LNIFNDTGVMEIPLFMTPVSIFRDKKAAKMAASSRINLQNAN